MQAGRALAPECYRDAAFFELERERVLALGWHAIARWDELPEPGDYKSIHLSGEPLVVVRDEARALRVFSRICRHRAHPIVEGSGNTKRFVCPYHRWAYGLDGALVGAPLMKDEAGFDADACSLPELPTEAWAGFVMTTLNPTPKPLAPQLAELDKHLLPHGLAEMVDVGVLEFDSPWNWKVMVENFMESYHHIGPHADGLAKTNLARETYPVDAKGPFALLENPGNEGNPDFYVAQVFPTTLIALFRGVSIGNWYEMHIDRYDHITLRVHLLAEAGMFKTPEQVEGLRAAVMKVHLEDIPVCEAVQAGLQSRLWEPGMLSSYEGTLAKFHRWLGEAIAG